MKTKQIILQCEGGLHLRVAAAIVSEVERRKSTVHMQCAGCPRANACSIMELLMLGAVRGTPVEVSAEGPDEEATIQAVTGYFTDGEGI